MARHGPLHTAATLSSRPPLIAHVPAQVARAVISDDVSVGHDVSVSGDVLVSGDVIRSVPLPSRSVIFLRGIYAGVFSPDSAVVGSSSDGEEFDR